MQWWHPPIQGQILSKAIVEWCLGTHILFWMQLKLKQIGEMREL
jgi:hypothetical protein